MTVQDFIPIYNETFKFIHDRHGKAAVEEFWKQMGKQYCFRLDQLMRQQGLAGMREFFYGDAGTATREHVTGEVVLSPDECREDVMDCPSVLELVNKGKDIYPYYCEHCYWLYGPTIEKHGYLYDVNWQMQEVGCERPFCSVRTAGPAGGCSPVGGSR